jgi:hypothetical protein
LFLWTEADVTALERFIGRCPAPAETDTKKATTAEAGDCDHA